MAVFKKRKADALFTVHTHTHTKKDQNPSVQIQAPDTYASQSTWDVAKYFVPLTQVHRCLPRLDAS